MISFHTFVAAVRTSSGSAAPSVRTEYRPPPLSKRYKIFANTEKTAEKGRLYVKT